MYRSKYLKYRTKYKTSQGGRSLSKYDPNAFLTRLGFSLEAILRARQASPSHPVYQYFIRLCDSEETVEQLETDFEVLFPLVYLLPIRLSTTKTIKNMVEPYYPNFRRHKIGDGTNGIIYGSGEWTVKINKEAYSFTDSDLKRDIPYGAFEFTQLLEEMAYYYLLVDWV